MAGEKSPIQTEEQERAHLVETVGPGTKRNYSLDMIAEMVTRWSQTRAFQGLARTFVSEDLAKAGVTGPFGRRFYLPIANAYAQEAWGRFKKRSGSRAAYDDDMDGPTGVTAKYLEGAPTSMVAAFAAIKEDVFKAGLAVWAQHNSTTEPALPGK